MHGFLMSAVSINYTYQCHYNQLKHLQRMGQLPVPISDRTWRI